MTGPVDELLELGEVHDRVEDPVHVALGHPEQRAVQVDVLPARQVLLEAGAELEEAGQLAPHGHLARGRLEHPADALEQRRLARAVAAEDADGLALPDRERHLAQGPEVVGRWRRPPWIMRSLSELYWPWASRKRLDTLRTSTAKSLTRSQLLGEVALEATEHGEGDQEEADGEEQHAEDQRGVPEVALCREDLGGDAAHR